MVRLDGSISGPGNPLGRGEVVMLFLTGLGPTLPILATGELGPSNPPAITGFTPTILVDNAPAEVQWTGYVPGLLGLYQANIVIPNAARSGPMTVSAIVNGVPSQISRCMIQ
jgi:uncharacterized protein (TIGR03437 family)